MGMIVIDCDGAILNRSQREELKDADLRPNVDSPADGDHPRKCDSDDLEDVECVTAS